MYLITLIQKKHGKPHNYCFSYAFLLKHDQQDSEYVYYLNNYFTAKTFNLIKVLVLKKRFVVRY